MRRYKTTSEAKQNLPEILERINTCKELYHCCNIMLEDIEKCCMEEDDDPEQKTDYGMWTSMNTYSMILRNQARYMEEIAYLHLILDWVKHHPSA